MFINVMVNAMINRNTLFIVPSNLWYSNFRYGLANIINEKNENILWIIHRRTKDPYILHPIFCLGKSISKLLFPFLINRILNYKPALT